MTIFNIMIQVSGGSGTKTGALEILNTLGLAVLLVGVGLLILMLAHYYRMRSNLERREKKQSARGGEESGLDIVKQYQFMSREEMKEMVLKELAASEETQEPEKAPMIKIGNHTAENLGASEAVSVDKLEPEEETPPAQHKEQISHLAAEAELLAKLTMPSEDEEVEEENTKQPYKDQIQRSILSNELPDEFKGKSRKI